MVKGFGITLEDNYGEIQDWDDIDLDWFKDNMTECNFDLGDEAETDDDGSSRYNLTSWPGALKPNGSTSSKIDLQTITWLLRGFLDQYLHSEGSNGLHVHEFWGGENHELQSFTGIATYDDLKLALFGLIVSSLKLEVSDSAMIASNDWVYADETGEILDVGETFVQPDTLEDSNIPIRFYDVNVYLNNEKPGSVQNSFNLEGNNNPDQDGTIGLGARGPQESPYCGKRNISLSLATTLNRRSYREILDARYGEVDAVKPSKCKIKKTDLKLEIVQCENPSQKLIIIFPDVTLKAEFELNGADRVEATLNLATLGGKKVTLNDGTTQVQTDMYCKLINKVPELAITTEEEEEGGS